MADEKEQEGEVMEHGEEEEEEEGSGEEEAEEGEEGEPEPKSQTNGVSFLVVFSLLLVE